MPWRSGDVTSWIASGSPEAATPLGKCATAAEGRELIPLLADGNTTVRNRALQSIGVLRVHEAGPALREMFMQNRRRELGTRVLKSLARTGDPAQGDLYRELLFSNDPDQRRLAVEGLARIADKTMLPAFKTDCQREKNADVRIAYAFAIGDGPLLRIEDLPPEVASSAGGGPEVLVAPEPPREAPPGESPEARRIRDALARTSGNRDRAAKLLGLSRVTLWRRMRDLGLDD